MQDDVTWKLSLLMDDELPPHEAIPLLERISQEEDLKIKWYRYQIIRQALRREEGIQPHPDFLGRVQKALASEIVPQTLPTKLPSLSFYRWIIIPAALAAVVMAAFLIVDKGGLLPMRPDSVATVVATESGLPLGARNTRKRAYSRLEDYLLAHSEDTLYLAGPQHMLGYARIVSHGSDH